MKPARLTDVLQRFTGDSRLKPRSRRPDTGALNSAVEQLEVRTLLSGDPVLVADLEANRLTDVNGTLYFVTSTPNHGHEIWQTDGTTTTRVTDIRQGSDGSLPQHLVNVNGTLYFSAFTDEHGSELWKLDGDQAVMVEDIRDGSDSSLPSGLFNVNGTLFFTADDGVHGRELWKYDGTQVVLVKDIHDGTEGSDPSRFAEVNGTLFFTADDGVNGRELWKYDGNEAVLVEDIEGDDPEALGPRDLVNVNGTLYFSAETDANGRELWKYDGTVAELVEDIRPGSSSSSPEELTNLNGTLFFAARTDANGWELWKHDGTNTVMVRDINGGAGDSYPENLTVVGDNLYFTATNGAFGEELWVTDGTTTERLTDIREGGDDSFPNNLTNVNGTLFFTAFSDQSGNELWKHDDSGIAQVSEIATGSSSSFPRYLTNVNGTLFFSAEALNDFQLYKVDAPAPAVTVALESTVTSLEENTDTSSAIKVADIVISGDEVGTRTLSLSGSDADAFEIIGTELFLKANTILDFETQSTFDVTVEVEDTGISGDPDATADFTLTLSDVNEAPVSVSLENTTTTLPENFDTSSAIKVADIVVTDDAPGTNTLSLAGDDAEHFEIIGTELFLKANTPLDFETQSTFNVTVQVDDTDVGNTPDATTDFTLTLTDVNEAPTLVLLRNLLNFIAENTDTSSPIKVADIDIADDALGNNTLSLSGADAGFFEIVGTELFVRAGTTLDFETQSAFRVTVEVTDADLSIGPHASTDFTLNVTDVDERPPLVRYVWTIFGWQVQTVRSYIPWLFPRW